MAILFSQLIPPIFLIFLLWQVMALLGHAAAILDALKTEPELYADVWAIHRISDRRWNVHLRTGLEVKLPEMDAALAWSKLAVLDRDTQIMKRDLSMIDLRILAN